MGKMIDLINKRFGKLVVIENMGKLRSGNTKSCGCMRNIGLIKYNAQKSEEASIPIGTKFGSLTVIKDIGFQEQVPGHKRKYYLCQCDCGILKEIMGNQLKQGHVISCGNCILSKGEYQITQLLKQNNIIYEHNITYEPLTKECGRQLRFDFIIYTSNHEIDRFVEFDGQQHYDGPDTKTWSRTTDTLQTIQERDKIKNNFCLSHQLKLIRIPYWHKNITYEDIFSDKYLIKGGENIK